MMLLASKFFPRGITELVVVLYVVVVTLVVESAALDRLETANRAKPTAVVIRNLFIGILP
jgi:hypothetical protein